MSYGKCNYCRKFGTKECPTSALCLRYEERPYFEPKEEKLGFLQRLIKKLGKADYNHDEQVGNPI